MEALEMLPVMAALTTETGFTTGADVVDLDTAGLLGSSPLAVITATSDSTATSLLAYLGVLIWLVALSIVVSIDLKRAMPHIRHRESHRHARPSHHTTSGEVHRP